jgi:hypothetical protein
MSAEIRYVYRLVPHGAPPTPTGVVPSAWLPADLVLMRRDDGGEEHEIARESYPTAAGAEFALLARLEEDE